MPSKTSTQVRNVIITINNWRLKSSAVLALYYLPATYKIIAYEVGSNTETEHIQALVFLGRRIRFKKFAEYFFGQAHIEPVRNKEKAIKYVKKDLSYDEYGSWDKTVPDKCERILEHLESGSSITDMLNDDPTNILKLNHIKLARQEYLPSRSEELQPCVIWIYGPRCA